ncbi:uncharacterized protein LOC113328689 [Papaver somniferum]|uniref:uncharacterized protein LOC113328689 n=1 Tax=Papaver somniferum TaxID=3469 RepID=UPI000E7007AF|nr:uncharacterized protein LOC113328689 [Papaver somniferum]
MGYGCGIWKGVFKFVDIFISNCKMQVGDGSLISFWGDRWISDTPLKILHPASYAISGCKGATVAEVRTSESDMISWNLSIDRRVYGGVITELTSLLDLLDNFNSCNISDIGRRIWLGGGGGGGGKSNGTFSVKSCYQLLLKTAPSPLKFIPKSRVCSNQWPTKVSFFLWVASYAKISTQDMMVRRGWKKDWVNHCYLCVQDGESSNHLLVHCKVALTVWCFFPNEFSLKWVIPPDFLSLISSRPVKANSLRKTLVLRCLPDAISWCLGKREIVELLKILVRM